MDDDTKSTMTKEEAAQRLRALDAERAALTAALAKEAAAEAAADDDSFRSVADGLRGTSGSARHASKIKIPDYTTPDEEAVWLRMCAHGLRTAGVWRETESAAAPGVLRAWPDDGAGGALMEEIDYSKHAPSVQRALRNSQEI